MFLVTRVLNLPPDPGVLAVFGAVGQPTRLEGGQGSTWRIGDHVLKPLDISEEELRWHEKVFSSIGGDGFRVAPPQRSRTGSLIVDGWCCRAWLPGRHEACRWQEIVAVGEQFHAALAAVDQPVFLARRSDPWAVGDRVAWGELPAGDFAHLKHVSRLIAALRPIEAPSQLIHGDLGGNVLFADGLPPAIIDFSPYWRPTGFAAAIVVGDALLWEGAGEELLGVFDGTPAFDQFLLRALIYRAVTDRLARADEPLRPDDADPFLLAVEIACRLARPS